MKRIGYHILGALVLVAMTSVAHAQTPNANGAHWTFRINPDNCPITNITTGGSYPSSFYIEESNLLCTGWANTHVWRFSEDGGATPAVFHNNSNFHFCADLVIEASHANGGEAGINIAPWWWLADGRINVRIPDGEIAAFGGRMPFVTWTNPADTQNYWGSSLHYVEGTTIHLEMTYISGPTGPSEASPGQVQFSVGYEGNTYTTPWLLLDMGNPAEDPPHGLWGILDPASAGGFMQARLTQTAEDFVRATWNNVCYDNLQVVPTQNTSWGRVKSLYN